MIKVKRNSALRSFGPEHRHGDGAWPGQYDASSDTYRCPATDFLEPLSSQATERAKAANAELVALTAKWDT
ncbi:hypothetical protein, partial [Massilia horti]|uniref:hypothetical protein n=1 Tax=Massilia horti TaxID=2562153 RepID=UPI0019826DE6